jgi:hypothetical protein
MEVYQWTKVKALRVETLVVATYQTLPVKRVAGAVCPMTLFREVSTLALSTVSTMYLTLFRAVQLNPFLRVERRAGFNPLPSPGII